MFMTTMIALYIYNDMEQLAIRAAAFNKVNTVEDINALQVKLMDAISFLRSNMALLILLRLTVCSIIYSLILR